MELSPPRAESELRVAADVAAIRFGGKGRWKTIATYNSANATDRFHSIGERNFFWKRGNLVAMRVTLRPRQGSPFHGSYTSIVVTCVIEWWFEKIWIII